MSNKSAHDYEHCGMQFVLHVTLLGKSSRCVMIVKFSSPLMELKSHNKSAHECKHGGIYFPCSSNLKHTRRVLRRVMIVDFGSLLCNLKATTRVLMSANIAEHSLLFM